MSKYELKVITFSSANAFFDSSGSFVAAVAAICAESKAHADQIIENFLEPKQEDWLDAVKVTKILLDICKCSIPLLEARLAEEMPCSKDG